MAFRWPLLERMSFYGKKEEQDGDHPKAQLFIFV
jgi:hypothetical protein